MNKAMEASRELKAMDELATLKSPIHSFCPLSKLLTTIFYIVVVMSFHKYDIVGLLVLILFPLIVYSISTIPASTCFKKLRLVLPLVILVGLFNPFFDRIVLFHIGSFAVTGGMVSMVTLMMKGVFSLMASFILIATTPIEEICSAMRKLFVPRILVVLILLTYRYIGIMLDEVAIMYDSYMLRAPRQNGIHVSAWGSFLGQLILRSMDKATSLYESMNLRGFKGEYDYRFAREKNRFSKLYAAIFCLLILACRFYNIPSLIGSLFT